MEYKPVPAEHKEIDNDDLKQIRGIGPGIEQRLHQAGIFKFAQLAEMSNQDLATLFSGMHGLSAERIVEKGWATQARQLMGKPSAGGISPSEEKGQYSALFSVDLLLDRENHVRRTHILHVQSRREDTWADWNKDRLAAFILENATIRSSLQSHPKAKEPKGKAVPVKGEIRVGTLELKDKSDQVTRWSVTANEGFSVDLRLDLSSTQLSAGTLVKYEVEIYVKNLANGQRQQIGSTAGVIESNALIPLRVNCHPLPRGTYRLDGYVTVSTDLENVDSASCLIAMTGGRVVRVN